MRLVVVGNVGSRRTALLSAAAGRWPGLAVVLVPWVELLAGRVDLRSVVRAGDVVRVDSPGKDFAAERALLRFGVDDDAMAGRVDALVEDRGRVLWPAVWYRGLCRALDAIAGQLVEAASHRPTNDPVEIKVTFDKTATSARLAAAGIPVPPAIGRIAGYDDLLTRMRDRGWPAVFVKLAHGSSASGSVALRTDDRGRLVAFTTVELDGVDPADGEPRMYNTRAIRRLTDARDVAAVVDAVARHAAHAERWLPKAGVDGRTFDLRVLVIAGRARHVVARLSRTPMTNLNLLNDRGDATLVRARSGDAWAGHLAACEAALRAFPRSLYGGVDLAIAPGFAKRAVLEVNAFGDLLPGATDDRGLDSYAAELAETFGPPAFAEVA